MTSATSWYRRYVWNYKGNREYTKAGYDYAKTRFVEDDLDVDCTDRHYIITGCNSGIGLEIGREVAKRGGVLHMVCRNFEAAKEARSEIITTTGNDKIHLHTVDMSRPREVLAWARDFAATHDRLHVLINNAGCMIHERRIDDDGLEYNFAVNTLAVHVLITALLPLLERSVDARVVNVSSAGMLCVKLDPHDLMHESMEPFNGRLIYSQNKRQQVVMTLWYAQRYDKVHFSSMHPGWADTLAVRTSIPQFYEMMKDNLRTAGEGADCAVWLAISKSALKHPSGLFFQDREPVSMHLPLAWTKSSIEDENLLMVKLDELIQKISAPKEKPDEGPQKEEQNGSPGDEPTSEQTVQEPETPKQANGSAKTTLPALVTCEGPVEPPVAQPAAVPAEKLAAELEEKCTVEDVAPAAKEEEKEALLAKEEAKEAPAAKEEEKEIPAAKEEETPAVKEEAKEAPAAKEEEKETPAAKPEETPAVKEEEKEAPAAKEEEKETPAAKEEEKDAPSAEAEEEPQTKTEEKGPESTAGEQQPATE